ncbi:MAG TPA: hypothetical protein VMH37_00415 [Candidatus Binataceae bacterium]|nr:hypothetical protein [Candidatus Binataceae bacterium]
MANLTIAIDEETLKKARLRAVSSDTSVNEVLRKFLESYAGTDTAQRTALDRLLTLSRKSRSRSSRGHRWTRDDLHERS